MLGLRYSKLLLIVDIILILLFIVISVFNTYSIIDKRDIIKDASEYLLMGYNLQKYGTLSLDDVDKPDPEPTAYREPAFPAYLAMVMKVIPSLRSKNLEQIHDLTGNPSSRIRQSLVILIIIIGFLTMYLMYLITRNILLSYLSLFSMGCSLAFSSIAKILYSELMTAVLILITVIFIFKVLDTRKYIYFIFTGISLALLVLSRATFMYFIFILVPVLVLILIKKYPEAKKKIFAGITLSMILYSLITGGWAYRNHRHFGDFFITNRGGINLLIRAKYNTMNYREYLASFVYWSPKTGIREKILDRYFEPSDYEKLDEFRNEKSYYMQATREVWGVSYDNKYQVVNDYVRSIKVDKNLRKMALRQLIDNPLRYMLSLIQFGWRGIFVENGYNFALPFYRYIFQRGSFILLFNPLLYLGFFAMFILSLIKKAWKLLTVLLAPLYMYFFNSFTSLSIPRYNIPMLPFLVLAFLALVFYLVKIRHKKTMYS